MVGSAYATDDTCLSCHSGLESSCNLSCTDCHATTGTGELSNDSEHPPIIRNPSEEKYWPQKCAPCHQQQIEHFKTSLHYSASGIIVQTRYLWGKSRALDFEQATELWKDLRRFLPDSGRTTAQLVDRLLAQKCLACHFASDTRKDGEGKKRPAGCAACHIPVDQKTGKPLHGHRMQRSVEDVVCLTCHNGNHVGADYYGYFEHDYHNDYQSPYGNVPEFDAFQHHLQPDVHQQIGMQCTDCHRGGHSQDFMTDNTYEGATKAIRCSDCHGGFGSLPKDTNTQAPRFDPGKIAHKDFHRHVTCIACHAGWSYQDYGLHLFLDESNHYQPWSDYLWQGDHQITSLLQTQLALPEAQRKPAETVNRLSGQLLPGAWYKGWTFRRWEGVILGKDSEGKYAPIRPLYQFYITYVDAQDNVWLDSVKPRTKSGQTGWNWDVYAPHTIMATGRACEDCHGNPLAAGMGIRNSAGDVVAHPITLPSAPILPGTRLLTPEEQKKLLRPSVNYKKWRARVFREQGILKLLKE